MTSFIVNPLQVIVFSSSLLIFCLISFSFLVYRRLNSWRIDNTPILPFASILTLTIYIVIIASLLSISTEALFQFGFSLLNSFRSSLFILLPTSLLVWFLLVTLLGQIESGSVKEMDDFF